MQEPIQPAQQQEEEEESKLQQAPYFELSEEEMSGLSTRDLKALLDRPAEYADSHQLSNISDLHSLMQNTIS